MNIKSSNEALAEAFSKGSNVTPHGVIIVDLGWRGGFRKVMFIGGPFRAAKTLGADTFKIAVRSEDIRPGDCDAHLPIRDFNVPDRVSETESVMRVAFREALYGRPVFVGCMGGFGRTGLFLALLAKAGGVEDPVSFVRENYLPSAVETRLQKKYVDEFDVSDIQKAIRRAAWCSRLPAFLRKT